MPRRRKNPSPISDRNRLRSLGSASLAGQAMHFRHSLREGHDMLPASLALKPKV